MDPDYCIVVSVLYNFLHIKEYFFFQSGKSLLTFPFSDQNTGSQQILFLSVTGIISVVPLISKIRFRLPYKFRISEFYISLITSALLIIILVITGSYRYDKKAKQYFYVENLFYQNKFNEVIAFNTLNPPSNSLTIFFNNIALCETDNWMICCFISSRVLMEKLSSLNGTWLVRYLTAADISITK